ncbi:hypothetical protein ACWEKT_39785 [Nocardia takedensis]
MTARTDHPSTPVATPTRDALRACRALHTDDGARSGYVVLRLDEARRIEIDHGLAGLDDAGLLCQLPEDHCRWVLYALTAAAPRLALILWLPDHAALTRRLAYTAATRHLRAHLPGGTLTLGVENRTELAHATLVDKLLNPHPRG